MIRRLLICVCTLIGTVIILNFQDIQNLMDPRTTFKKEIMDNIEDKKVSSLEFYFSSNENEIITKDKKDINRILEILSEMNLKRGKNTTDKEIWIDVRVQGERRYLLALSDDKSQITIINYRDKKNIINHYTIENNFDLDKIKVILNKLSPE
ncbi:hypothetical protein M3650_12250 [Paenibacillus sp. MER TA 81-3]|uniref:hypothetical protein n=1 Tax=Paenibacillus sp. MER TA 81-3 TaxID=2939573 RepID=UPI0020405C7C|nr:hypothetical protein [Paenibacillus sp. MER TA 81-3]MCM3339387.1 hypothetical protein [Paenibacillus sp. MER TA 81-3]